MIGSTFICFAPETLLVGLWLMTLIGEVTFLSRSQGRRLLAPTLLLGALTSGMLLVATSSLFGGASVCAGSFGAGAWVRDGVSDFFKLVLLVVALPFGISALLASRTKEGLPHRQGDFLLGVLSQLCLGMILLSVQDLLALAVGVLCMTLLNAMLGPFERGELQTHEGPDPARRALRDHFGAFLGTALFLSAIVVVFAYTGTTKIAEARRWFEVAIKTDPTALRALWIVLGLTLAAGGFFMNGIPLFSTSYEGVANAPRTALLPQLLLARMVFLSILFHVSLHFGDLTADTDLSWFAANVLLCLSALLGIGAGVMALVESRVTRWLGTLLIANFSKYLAFFGLGFGSWRASGLAETLLMALLSETLAFAGVCFIVEGRERRLTRNPLSGHRTTWKELGLGAEKRMMAKAGDRTGANLWYVELALLIPLLAGAAGVFPSPLSVSWIALFQASLKNGTVGLTVVQAISSGLVSIALLRVCWVLFVAKFPKREEPDTSDGAVVAATRGPRTSALVGFFCFLLPHLILLLAFQSVWDVSKRAVRSIFW